MHLQVSRFVEPGRELAICATAAWNGLGFNPHQIWAFRRAQIAAHAETPFRLPNGSKATMIHIRTLPPRTQGVDRMVPVIRRLLPPILQLLAPLGPRARIAVELALAERFADGAGPEAQARRRRIEGEVAALSRTAGIEPVIRSQPRGHAALATGVIEAGTAVVNGSFDAAILGGVDTYYDADVIDRLVEEKRLFDGENLEGFIPGEGGAFLLVARRDVARRNRWPVLGLIEAAATDQEPAALDPELPITAGALSRCIRAVCDPLEKERRSVDLVFSDLTHERWRVQEWGLALPRASVGPVSPEPRMELVVPFQGDLGAAALPTALTVAAEMHARHEHERRTALACASSAGLERTAMLVRG